MMTISDPVKGSPTEIRRYLEQLQTEKVGQLEDYYGRDTRNRWMGGAAQAQGLAGQPVGHDDFLAAASGYLPDATGSVRNAGDPDRRAGWDCTFSAPKSVSIAFALADETRQREIEDAMFRSVEAAWAYAERHCITTRTGAGGFQQMKAKVLAACYLHHTSRALDPQLHIHSFVNNVVLSEDGQARTLESQPLCQWQYAVGAAFRVQLAQEMQALGYTVERDEAFFRLAEIPPELDMEFDTRREQILADLRAKGIAYSSRAAQIACLDTRQPKVPRDHEDLLADWRERAGDILAVLEQDPHERERQDLAAIAAGELAGRADQLTDKSAVFKACEAHQATLLAYQGTGSIEAGEAEAEAFLENQVRLPTQWRMYSTEEMIALEKGNLSRAKTLNERTTHAVDPAIVEEEIARSKTLSEEQREAIRHICAGGDIRMVQGFAGTGKSFALATAVRAYKRAGYEVHGLAPTGPASDELQEKIGTESITIARANLDIYGGTVEEIDEDGKITEKEVPARGGWNRNQVYFMDEVGMVSTRDMDKLLREAERAGAKIIGVGDTRQLQSIQAGAPARQLKLALGYASLDEIRRQEEVVDRAVVRNIRNGRALDAFASLAERDRLVVAETGRRAKEQLAIDLHEDLQAGRDAYCLAERRTDIRDINEQVRTLAKAEGGLADGRDYEVRIRGAEGNPRVEKREFATGDRIVFLKNINTPRQAQALGGKVKNGWIGTITSLDKEGNIEVELEDASTRRFNLNRDYNYLDHGYALTVHKSQGSTFEISRNYISSQGFGGLEIGYVSSSRAKRETYFYGTQFGFEDTVERWHDTRQQVAALDYLEQTGNPEALRLGAEERLAVREGAKTLMDSYVATHEVLADEQQPAQTPAQAETQGAQLQRVHEQFQKRRQQQGQFQGQ